MHKTGNRAFKLKLLLYVDRQSILSQKVGQNLFAIIDFLVNQLSGPRDDLVIYIKEMRSDERTCLKTHATYLA